MAICLRIALAISLVIFGIAQLIAPAKARGAASVDEVLVTALRLEVYVWARSSLDLATNSLFVDFV